MLSQNSTTIGSQGFRIAPTVCTCDGRAVRHVWGDAGTMRSMVYSSAVPLIWWKRLVLAVHTMEEKDGVAGYLPWWILKDELLGCCKFYSQENDSAPDHKRRRKEGMFSNTPNAADTST